MITGAQCQAARALAEITVSKLAKRSKVDRSLIESFEQKRGKPDAQSIAKLKLTLEELGVVFLDENGSSVGVRLKFSRSDSKQIARMEDEGGIVASDDVP